jgi:D,D-heptose 1,7-bisphosphate phosphatase
LFPRPCSALCRGRIRITGTHLKPAIFLDRDGTLNFDYGWITSPSKIELLPGAAEAVRAINEAEFLAVLVTNQPVIARGECSEAELTAIHERLKVLLTKSDAHLDAIYYCPHHPDSGFPGERRELKIRCHCRKPSPGLLESAARDLNIDVTRSWMIGDSERDLGAAAAFGIPAALVASNQQWFKEGIVSREAFRAPSVLEAVRRILKTTTFSC